MAPSRRQPTSNIASARGASVEQEEEAETVEQRHARLRAAVLERRQLQEIEEMEQELAGGSPASSGVLGSSSTKRPASQDISMRHRRAFPPPLFKGTSFKELRDFLLGCDVFFGAVKEQDGGERIAIAASYLREEALRTWSRLDSKPTTWAEFERVCRDMVQDPANRMAIASLKLKEMRQGTLSVRQLVSAIEELEDEVPILTDEERKAWVLLNCLDPDLRTAVLREERTIRTRTQVQNAAQRLQELGVVEKRSGSAEKAAIPARVDSEARTSVGHDRTCFRCGEKGHIKRHCTASVTSGTSSGKGKQ